MVFLLVDGDYFLTGFQPSSDAEVSAAITELEASLHDQLLYKGNNNTSNNNNNSSSGADFDRTNYRNVVEIRVVLFSSALINSLAPKEKNTLISTFRRFRYQTNILDNFAKRPGSPIDAALCTKAISFAMMPRTQGTNAGTNAVPPAYAAAAAAGSTPAVDSSDRQLFCFVTANAYLSSALDFITSRSTTACDVLFVLYEKDEVAEELLSYISPFYANRRHTSAGSGIATMPRKNKGVCFIPNTEAAAAALAIMQQEGKDLPISVLSELKKMQESLTTRSTSRLGAAVAASHASAPAERKESYIQRQHQQELYLPPPIPGLPNPLEASKLQQEFSEGEASPSLSVVTNHHCDQSSNAANPPPSYTSPPPSVNHNNNNNNNNSSNSYTADVFANLMTGDTHLATTAMNAEQHITAEPPVSSPSTSTAHRLNLINQLQLGQDANHSNKDFLHFLETTTVEPKVSTMLPKQWSLFYDGKRKQHYYCYTDSQGRQRTTWQHPLGSNKQNELEAGCLIWFQDYFFNHPNSGSVGKPAPTESQQLSQLLDDLNGSKNNNNNNNNDNKNNNNNNNNNGPAAPELPVGWEERVDPRSGRTFYINHNTKETTWNKPTRDQSNNNNNNNNNNTNNNGKNKSANANTDDEWEEKLDANTGRTFYINHKLKQTTWTKPEKLKTPQQQQSVSVDSNANQNSVSSTNSEWESRIDPRSGRTFYINHRTKETTWNKPQGFAEPVPNNNTNNNTNNNNNASNWEQRVDPNTGRTFYINHQTKQTSWTKPQ